MPSGVLLLLSVLSWRCVQFAVAQTTSITSCSPNELWVRIGEATRFDVIDIHSIGIQLGRTKSMLDIRVCFEPLPIWR